MQTLDDLLPNATRYFAIGTIPLKDWFDPDAQVYLATIIRYQHAPTEVRHERVLIFFSDYQLKALKASYLDEHHARCILAIHKRFEIPLGYLGPVELRDILQSLSEDYRRALGCYRWGSRVLPKAWRMRKKPNVLPFAMVVMKNGEVKFLKFTKSNTVLGLDEIQNQSVVSACQALISATEVKIYVPGQAPRQLKHEFNFSDLICP